jgi:hypothetical protein
MRRQRTRIWRRNGPYFKESDPLEQWRLAREELRRSNDGPTDEFGLGGERRIEELGEEARGAVGTRDVECEHAAGKP